MAGLDVIDVELAFLSRAFCSPLAVFVQIQVRIFSVKFRFVFRRFAFTPC
jgi:hypothetical protein